MHQMTKRVSFRGASCARTGPDRLVGQVLEITASLRNNKGLNVLCFPGKTERGSFDYIEARKCFGFAVVGPQGINCPCKLSVLAKSQRMGYHLGRCM